MGDEVGIDFGHFLGDQAVLHGLGTIGKGLLIAESDRAQLHETAAGIAHVLDIFLEAARRADGNQLAAGIDEDGDGAVVACGNAIDSCSEECRLGSIGSDASGAIVRRRAQAADVNIVAIARRDVVRRVITDSDIVGPRDVECESSGAQGRVVIAGVVVAERRPTGGSIFASRGVELECGLAASCVVAPSGVVAKCGPPIGRIEVPSGVVLKRVVATGRVLTSGAVA